MNSRNLQINLLIRAFVWITIIAFILLGLFYKVIQVQLTSISKIIGFTVSFILALWFVLDKWAWKLKFFQRWFNYPDLNGTWKGTLVKSSTTSRERPIELVINQTLSKISCVYRSDTRGVNRSYAVNIIYDPDLQVKKLIFSYNYNQFNNVSNNDHRGTCDLDISNGDCDRSLIGRYWTCKEIPTTGTISLTYHSKVKYDSYQGDLNNP